MTKITVGNIRPDMYMQPGTKADCSEDKLVPRRKLVDVETVKAAIQAAAMPNGMFSALHVQGYITEWTPGWRGTVSPKEDSKVNEVWINQFEVVTNTNAGGEYARVAVRTSRSGADQVFLQRVGVNPEDPFRLATGDGFMSVLPISVEQELEFQPRLRPVERTEAMDMVEVVLPFPGMVADDSGNTTFKLLVPAQGDARFVDVIDIAELKRRGELL